MWWNLQSPQFHLVIFTEEILTENVIFCAVFLLDFLSILSRCCLSKIEACTCSEKFRKIQKDTFFIEYFRATASEQQEQQLEKLGYQEYNSTWVDPLKFFLSLIRLIIFYEGNLTPL